MDEEEFVEDMVEDAVVAAGIVVVVGCLMRDR